MLNVKSLTEATMEPPLTRHLSGPQLVSLLETSLQTNLPVMTVAVERAVKDVTKVAGKASSAIERDGIVLQTIASRNKFPIKKRK